MKSPLSKAEHEFLESETTKPLLNSRTLSSLSHNYGASDEYLKNRIRIAFLAGWVACENQKKKGKT